MRRLLAGILVFGGLAFAAAAHADTYQFNISGSANAGQMGTFSGTGLLTTTSLTGSSPFAITSISGSSDGVTFSSPTTSFNGADNMLFPLGNTGNYFDGSGFSFDLTIGNSATQVNVYYSGGQYFAYFLDSDNTTNTLPLDNVSVTATPEPSSFVLLGTGLLGAVGVARRKLFS